MGREAQELGGGGGGGEGGAAGDMDRDGSDVGSLCVRMHPAAAASKNQKRKWRRCGGRRGQAIALWASRHLLQPPETTTTGTCPAISGTTQYPPCFGCLRLVGLSLLNLAHSSQLQDTKGPSYKPPLARGGRVVCLPCGPSQSDKIQKAGGRRWRRILAER